MDALCTRYLPIVYNRVRVLVPPEDVEDVTQEVFVAVARSIGRYRAMASVKTWLYSISRRKVADFYRSRGRCLVTVPLGEGDVEGPSGRTIGPAGDRMEERALVRVAMMQLSAHYQDILFLRFAEGQRFYEIAVNLGISVEAAKSRYRRAVKAFKEIVDA